MEKPSDRGCYTISFLNATKRLSKGSGKKHISWDSILHPDPSSSIFYLATVVKQNYSIHRYSCCCLHYHKKIWPQQNARRYLFNENCFFQMQKLAHYYLVCVFHHYWCINIVICEESWFISNSNISKKFVILVCTMKPMCKIKLSLLTGGLQWVNDANRPSPFRLTLFFVTFSNNARTFNIFISCCWLNFPRISILFVQTFIKVEMSYNRVSNGFLTRRFAIKLWCELSLNSYKTFSFNVYFNNKNSFFNC